VHTHTMSI